MPKKAGIVMIILGAVLMLSALLLLFSNTQEDTQAGQEAEILLAQVKAAAPVAPPQETVPLATSDPELPVAIIDGEAYVGRLSIPALSLELPIMAQWDYSRLKKAPCRQFGSSRSDDFVIAAHNYSTHFGKLKNLTGGEVVTFTDMDGIENLYTVAQVRTIEAEDVEAVVDSGYALVLYTCTTGGKTRVAVFCQRSEP